MTFNPADANYTVYLNYIAPLDGYTKGQFDVFLVRWLAEQVTAGTTLSAANFAAALPLVLKSVQTGNYQF